MNKFPKNFLFLILIGGTTSWLLYPVIRYKLWGEPQAWISIVYWILGLVIGWIVFFIDRLVDIYITHPDTKLATYVKQYIDQKEYFKGWKLLMFNKKMQKNLTFRSALFHAVWIGLVFFVTTSTSSLFGKGFVMGLGFHLLMDEWVDFWEDRIELKKWLFWQINREISSKELEYFMYIVSGLYIIILLTML